MQKIAAGLALLIGALAVLAGGQVLLGNDPGYYVIAWLPVYNFVLGVLSVFIASPLIWKNSRFAMPVAIGILCVHVIVMLILLAAYRDVVAIDSLVAMTLRIAAWLIILALMVTQSRKHKALIPQNE